MSPSPRSKTDGYDFNDAHGMDALLPPNTRRSAGRRKKKRIQHEVEMEPQRILKCGRCRGPGVQDTIESDLYKSYMIVY
jgi:hypothetical protein